MGLLLGQSFVIVEHVVAYIHRVLHCVFAVFDDLQKFDLASRLRAVLLAPGTALAVDGLPRFVHCAQEIDPLHQLKHLVKRVCLHEQLLVFERDVVCVLVGGLCLDRGGAPADRAMVLRSSRTGLTTVGLAFAMTVLRMVFHVMKTGRYRDRL